jgi:dipeptidyl aminopeptidase/acylaminoacyl peptidase
MHQCPEAVKSRHQELQYRGIGGGEGVEQFGGKDVDDVAKEIALARRLPEADPRSIFIYGTSRGGMMVYPAVRDDAKVNAAVTFSGMVDLS